MGYASEPPEHVGRDPRAALAVDAGMDDLPPDLSELVEPLAERVHEAWMEGRLADGWTLGASRDDGRKLHPCLVPYDDLPESEKEVDRRTVRATLVALLESGYSVVRSGS